jgi:hypothetical protein
LALRASVNTSTNLGFAFTSSIIPIPAAFGQRVAQFAQQAVCEAQETLK